MSEMAPIPTEFCAMQQLELSAINRHNQRLFDDLGGAQQNRWGYGKAKRRGETDHLKTAAIRSVSTQSGSGPYLFGPAVPRMKPRTMSQTKLTPSRPHPRTSTSKVGEF